MARVLVTGGNGFLGSGVLEALAALVESGSGGVETVVCGDLALPRHPLPDVVYEVCDVTSATVVDAVISRHRIDTVVHLASIVNPGQATTREMEYRIDVEGSRNVLHGCLANNVKRLIVSSSGAAYGYHADNPAWLREGDALRGNDAFAYAQHKRLVEEMLAEARAEHPELEQTVFRIGTILGAHVDNQITALFEKKRILKIAGSESPFVFIWNEDVVGAIVQAVTGPVTGVFNVAGDGSLTISELARMLGTPVRELPAWLVSLALRVGHALRLTVHGPEQLAFLRYRPVLANDKLKREFGYRPRYSSRHAFEAWMAARG